VKFLDKIKGKVDKKALYQTIGLLLISWLAFPAIYYLIVNKNKKKVKENENVGQNR